MHLLPSLSPADIFPSLLLTLSFHLSLSLSHSPPSSSSSSHSRERQGRCLKPLKLFTDATDAVTLRNDFRFITGQLPAPQRHLTTFHLRREDEKRRRAKRGARHRETEWRSGDVNETLMVKTALPKNINYSCQKYSKPLTFFKFKLI